VTGIVYFFFGVFELNRAYIWIPSEPSMQAVWYRGALRSVVLYTDYIFAGTSDIPIIPAATQDFLNFFLLHKIK
jgi:hypothetical protein